MSKADAAHLTGFRTYQEFSRNTDIYPVETNKLTHALGLASEAGEVCGKITKAYRDKGGDVDVAELKKELGDVLWFISILACDFDITLEDIAQTNILKLSKRAREGKLGGSGDNR